MCRWLNYHVIKEALREHPLDDALDILLDALDEVLSRSDGPTVEYSAIPAPDGRAERTVAWLPGGWVLVFSVFENGPPPHSGCHLVAREMYRP